MKKWKKTSEKARRRRMRVRRTLRGTGDRPRLTVFRSNRFIYAQVIDDDTGCTLASSSSRTLSVAGSLKAKYPGNREAAKEVGTDIAAKAKENGIARVRFDRGPYKYHGRVMAVAEGAREGGLDF